MESSVCFLAELERSYSLRVNQYLVDDRVNYSICAHTTKLIFTVSMLEELMLVLNEAPQNTESEAPSPAVTETTSQGKAVFHYWRTLYRLH